MNIQSLLKMKLTDLRKYKNNNNMKDKWYVVRVQGNREKSISEKLKKYSTDGKLTGKLSEVVSPMKKEFMVVNGKKIKKEKALYPGYVFVKTNSMGELKYFFKQMDGVSGFLSDRKGEPQSLTEKEVNKMIDNHEEEVNKETVLELKADSDSFLVKGLLAIIISIFSGKTPSNILKINYNNELEKLNLKENISQQRSNGLTAVINKVISEAQKRV